MNTRSNAIPGSPVRSGVIAPAVISEAQLLYWSIRREFWEYRSIYIAPLAVAAVYLLAFLVATISGIWEKALRLDPTQSAAKLAEPYALAAGLIMGTTFVIGIFYSLDALHGEGRDRSILFWKSLPVSDLTTVLSKASIPIVVLPSLTFVVTVAMQFVMLWISTVVLIVSGQEVLTLWRQLPLLQMTTGLLYHLMIGHVLWYAPIYSWLLLVSAWARRAPILWAGLPLLVIGFAEKLAFNTAHFAHMLQNRLVGSQSFDLMPDNSLGHPMSHSMARDGLAFMSSPGIWMGLALAAVFLAAAVRLRRYRGPV